MGFIGQLVVSLAQPGLLEYYLGLHPLASDFQYWQLGYLCLFAWRDHAPFFQHVCIVDVWHAD